MSYKVCKNKLNDFTYITFGNIKAQVINTTNELVIYKDKSNHGEFNNLQLLKVIKEVNITDTDYDEIYKISSNWLDGKN